MSSSSGRRRASAGSITTARGGLLQGKGGGKEEDLKERAIKSVKQGLARLWRRRSVTITEYDPSYKVAYLGNVITGWAKGEGCVEKPLCTLWKNYSSTSKPDVQMKLTVTQSGLKAVTKQHGLTEYWSHRVTYCAAPTAFPKVFCWVYRHEGRKLKQELRCHAVLCRKESTATRMAEQLSCRLVQALSEFKRDKLSRQNARLSLANAVYDNPSLPRRKILLSTGSHNYRPPLERSKSAPKLMAIEESLEEDEDSELLRKSFRRPRFNSSFGRVEDVNGIKSILPSDLLRKSIRRSKKSSKPDFMKPPKKEGIQEEAAVLKNDTNNNKNKETREEEEESQPACEELLDDENKVIDNPSGTDCVKDISEMKWSRFDDDEDPTTDHETEDLSSRLKSVTYEDCPHFKEFFALHIIDEPSIDPVERDRQDGVDGDDEDDTSSYRDDTDGQVLLDRILDENEDGDEEDEEDIPGYQEIHHTRHYLHHQPDHLLLLLRSNSQAEDNPSLPNINNRNSSFNSSSNSNNSNTNSLVRDRRRLFEKLQKEADVVQNDDADDQIKRNDGCSLVQNRRRLFENRPQHHYPELAFQDNLEKSYLELDEDSTPSLQSISSGSDTSSKTTDSAVQRISTARPHYDLDSLSEEDSDESGYVESVLQETAPDDKERDLPHHQLVKSCVLSPKTTACLHV